MPSFTDNGDSSSDLPGGLLFDRTIQKLYAFMTPFLILVVVFVLRSSVVGSQS